MGEVRLIEGGFSKQSGRNQFEIREPKLSFETSQQELVSTSY